ncbi:MAG TPA: CBS domain-containing protein, partial [Planctomycetota bacterium]|nr:CBS domain-containing protein [Planctomycetota bacterium]
VRKKACDMMSRFPETIRPGASVHEAAVRMRAFGIGFLPVISGDEVVGVVTDRDLVTRALGSGLPANRIPVSDVMTTNVICCEAGASVDSVARTMAVLQVRRVLVTGPGRRVVGVIGLADLVGARYETLAALILGFISRVLPSVPPSLPGL